MTRLSRRLACRSRKSRRLSLLQNYRVILSGRRVEALCEGGGTRHALFLAHRQFLGEFEGMLGALPGNLIVAAAAAGSGIR